MKHIAVLGSTGSIGTQTLEVVRANLATWYRDLVDVLPEIHMGRAMLPDRPGLGVCLKPEVKQRPDAILRESVRR